MGKFWEVLGDVASVLAIVTLPYLLVNARRRSPRFSLSFHGRSRQTFERDSMQWATIACSGTIRNQSLDANTIEKIYYVVWRKGRKGHRSFGWSPNAVIVEGDQRISLPLNFGPRQARTIRVEFEISLTGSHDLALITATEPLKSNPMYQLPKYEYELAFEDVMGNLFDEQGVPRNKKGADLRWTLDNAIDLAKDGKIRPLVKHLSLIYATDLTFAVRRVVRRLGL